MLDSSISTTNMLVIGRASSPHTRCTAHDAPHMPSTPSAARSHARLSFRPHIRASAQPHHPIAMPYAPNMHPHALPRSTPPSRRRSCRMPCRHHSKKHIVTIRKACRDRAKRMLALTASPTKAHSESIGSQAPPARAASPAQPTIATHHGSPTPHPPTLRNAPNPLRQPIPTAPPAG